MYTILFHKIYKKIEMQMDGFLYTRQILSETLKYELFQTNGMCCVHSTCIQKQFNNDYN